MPALKKSTVLFAVLVILTVMAGIIAWRVRFFETAGLFPTAVAGRTIVVDPGHGGVDPGAHYRGEILEKELVLSIAEEVRRYLTSAGAEVIMTRTSDRDLAPPDITSLAARKRRDLKARVSLANRAKADLYLSIHINSSRDPNKTGVYVFYSPKPGSKQLAERIEQEAWRYLGKQRSPLPGTFYILRETEMPAVLVEAGFISNPQEKRLLCDKRYQEKVAWVVFRGVVSYFEQPYPGVFKGNDIQQKL
ncbi:MAG: N-acetylmuramoyl-L-alanine amidase [Bacillota bacterium]